MEAFCWRRRGGDFVEAKWWWWGQGRDGGGFGGPLGDLLSVGFSLFRRAELNIITIAHTRRW